MKKLISKKTENRVILLLKLSAGIALIWILYSKLDSSDEFTVNSLRDLFKKLFSNYWIILMLIALTIINWISDTMVWYKILNKIDSFSFGEVLKVNLISQYLGVVTPFAIGEYGAKMKLFKSIYEKKQSILITLSYRLSKTLVKILIGAVAFFMLIISDTAQFNLNDKILISVLLILVIVALLFSETIFKLLLKLPFLKNKKEDNWLKSNHLRLHKTIIPATIKFLSYCIQFAIIVVFTNESVPFWYVLIIGILLYTVGSFIPQFSILDPFVKGSIGILISQDTFTQESIVLATLIVWLLNVGIPSIYGAISWLISKPKKLESL